MSHAKVLLAQKQTDLDSILEQIEDGVTVISKEQKRKVKRSKLLPNTMNQAVQVPEVLPSKAFTEEEKRRSITLMYASLKSYRLLKSMNLGIKLGSVPSVRRWVKNYKCAPGHHNESFVLLRCKVETFTDPLDKNCAIMFDGMATKSVSKWSPTLKTVIPGSSNCNVVLIRGLNTNWKHIIYYDFRNCIDRETLDTIVVRIQTTGLVVKVLIMDLGNHTIQSELRFSEGARSFKNPSLPGDILINPDPIHNFKSMRNHLLDHGIVFQLEDGRRVPIGMETFRMVKDRQAKLGEATMCPKLKEKHLNCEGHSRQNVLLVFQLLSRSVANCLRVLGEADKGEVINIINDFMDLCNSRRKFHWNPLECGYGLHLEEQRRCLERFRHLVENMRVNPPKPKPGKEYKRKLSERKRHTFPPFQKGLLCNIDTIVALSDDLLRSGQEYIFLSKVN